METKDLRGRTEIVPGETTRNPTTPLAAYVKRKRRDNGLTQEDLAWKAGVGLRFVRDLEQGKETLRMDKANRVLALFGASLMPASVNRGHDEQPS